MENSEPELADLCNQEKLSEMTLGYRLSHKTFNLQSILPASCTGAVEAQNLWEWPTDDQSNLRPKHKRSPCLTLPGPLGISSWIAQRHTIEKTNQ